MLKLLLGVGFYLFTRLAPFLEKSCPMASAIGPPEVATAGAVEAAVVPPVIASSSAADARSPGNENERRTSEIDNRQTHLITPVDRPLLLAPFISPILPLFLKFS